MPATAQALQDRIEVLEEVIGLRVDCDPEKIKALGLQRQQIDILKLLLGARVATYRYLTSALYGADPEGGPDGPDNNIKVQVSRMRQKLAPLGIRIETLWGEGYYLADSSKAQARRLLGIGEN